LQDAINIVGALQNKEIIGIPLLTQTFEELVRKVIALSSSSYTENDERNVSSDDSGRGKDGCIQALQNLFKTVNPFEIWKYFHLENNLAIDDMNQIVSFLITIFGWKDQQMENIHFPFMVIKYIYLLKVQFKTFNVKEISYESQLSCLSGLYILLTQMAHNLNFSVDAPDDHWDLETIYSSIVYFYQDPTADIFDKGFPSGKNLMSRALEYFSVNFTDIVTDLCDDGAIDSLKSVEILLKCNQIWLILVKNYTLQDKSKILVQEALVLAAENVFKENSLNLRFLLLNLWTVS
jgi:hypothetical protein